LQIYKNILYCSWVGNSLEPLRFWLIQNRALSLCLVAFSNRITGSTYPETALVVPLMLPSIGYGRIFDQSGNAITIGGNAGDFVLISSGTNDIASAVSDLFGGEFVTVWQDGDTSDGSLDRVLACRRKTSRTRPG